MNARGQTGRVKLDTVSIASGAGAAQQDSPLGWRVYCVVIMEITFHGAAREETAAIAFANSLVDRFAATVTVPKLGERVDLSWLCTRGPRGPGQTGTETRCVWTRPRDRFSAYPTVKSATWTSSW